MPISNPAPRVRPSGLTPPNQPRLLSFPSGGGPHTMLMTFKQYEYEFARAGEQVLLNLSVNGRPLSGADVRRESINRRSGGSRFSGQLSGIELPIPTNLKDSDMMRVEMITQSPLEVAAGEFIAQGANALQGSNLTMRNLPGALQEFGASLDPNRMASQGAGAAMTAINALLDQSVGSMSRDIMYLLRSYLPSGVSQVTDRVLGSTVNPKASLAFEGVELKQHSFSWTLIPKNETDSEIIRAIIETVKKNSLPTYQTFAGTNFKAYLKYPSIVDIYLLGVNPAYFLKFKSAMIRSVHVEYGSTGIVSIVKGGKPGNVSLSIDLVELDIHTAEDYGAVGSTVTQTTAEDLAAVSFEAEVGGQ
jgi:hypothetical protein